MKRKRPIHTIVKVVAFMGFLVVVGLLPASGLGWSSVVVIGMKLHEPFYTPPQAKVEVGQPIQWSNLSPLPHTITHDGCQRGGACAFQSGVIHPGKRFGVTQLPPGVYSYHCDIHPVMRGIVIVEQPSRQPAAPRYLIVL